MGLVGLFLAAPFLVVVGVSVNEKKTLTFPPQGFSLQWFGEIVSDPDGRPWLTVSGTVAAVAAERGIQRWHLSLSHDGGIASAMVVAEA